MSAPQTNLEKQKQRHKGPLGGMALVVVLALVLMVLLGAWVVWRGDSPDGADVTIDGRTGETQPVETPVTPFPAQPVTPGAAPPVTPN
jgi:hypothetical protein